MRKKKTKTNKDNGLVTAKKPANAKMTATSYMNVNRAKKGYRDKYRKEVEKAIKEYSHKLNKSMEDGSDFTDDDWKSFFKTILIPLDKLSEQKMIELFKDNRDELNNLLVLHNTKASDNLAEVYYKRYQKSSPTQWHDLDDFKQMALEGLAIAAKKFKPSSGNKFITYATWWVLNRVRHPYQEKNANIFHSSMNAQLTQEDGNPTTLEEVLDPNLIAAGFYYPGRDEATVNPLAAMEKEMVDDCQELFTYLKGMEGSDMEKLDKDKARKMADYLADIVDENEEYGKRQIFLYLFKKIFNKCSTFCNDGEATRLNSYVNEAAKSKAELLNRLNMNEKQYEATCRKLTKGAYDGL